MDWIEVNKKERIPQARPLLCYCPKWCDGGYQVAYYNGRVFEYEDQPNDNFDQHVESWAMFLEAY